MSSSELRRGPWTCDEDKLLVQYVSCHGEGRWNSLAKVAGLNRTGKSCRLRWLNYLKPDIKRGNLTLEEQLLILQLHSKWGNRWSKIAQHLPGRTDNEIKNYWRTRVQKQARQLKVDSKSTKFIEALHSVWMPRLIEKMEQGSVETSLPKLQALTPSHVGPTYKSESDLLELPANIGSLVQFGNSVEEDCYDFSECQVEGMDWLGEDLRTPYWKLEH